MNEPIRVTVPAPIADVWPALRDPALIRRWHGWEIDEGGGLDSEIEFIFLKNGIADEEAHTLHVGGHLFTLQDHGSQTVVEVTRTTPPADDSMDWDAFYDDIDEGWRSFVEQLRFAVTHQWGRDRRTLHLDGESIADPPVPVADALGLRDAAALQPGERYADDVAGEHLSGEVWFRSQHQLGLMVDAWGPGLLLLAEAPNSGRRNASATLTMYDDDERDAQWRDAWAQAYRSPEPA
jgi:hypothetical protein